MVFGERRLTYAQLNEIVARYTGVFKHLGLGPKDVVAALDTNSERYIASLLRRRQGRADVPCR